MRMDNVMMMIVVGLVIGERANRIFGSGVYWLRAKRNNGRMNSGSGTASGSRSQDSTSDYLEKLVTEYEIIPLMSKLI